MRDSGVRALPWLLAASLCLASPAAADEPTRLKWFVGGSVAWRSTTDEIRSNAGISIGNLGADGIPFTYDAGETQGCAEPGTFCDLRPDTLQNTATVIQEAYQGGLQAGFSPVSWLSVELDAAYFKADVGPVSAFLSDHYPVPSDPNNLLTLLRFTDREVIFPLRAGTLTEVPITLTVAVQFKTRSALKPYLGAGFGRIFTDFDVDSGIGSFNDRIAHMRIRTIADKFGKNVVPRNYHDPLNDARIPMPEAVRVEHVDSSEWHLAGGAEWRLDQRIGVVFDARYSFAPGAIRFDIAGHDQVDLLIWSEKIYRPDGSVMIFQPGFLPRTPLGAPPPNPLCFDNKYHGYGCDLIHMEPGLARVDPEAPDFRGNIVPCPTFADFDQDGSVDVCYPRSIAPSGRGVSEARGDVVIQGGDIRYSAFTVSVGIRLHF